MRRARVLGIAAATIATTLLTACTGAATTSAPTVTVTATATVTATVVATPPPEPSPTAAATAWLISPEGVGPIRLASAGADFAANVGDDRLLCAESSLPWRMGATESAVQISGIDSDPDDPAPATAEGITLGSTLDEAEDAGFIVRTMDDSELVRTEGDVPILLQMSDGVVTSIVVGSDGLLLYDCG